MTRKISIFGATGSIGQNTLDLVSRDRKTFEIIVLTGGANVEKLAHDARTFNAQIAVTAFDNQLEALRQALFGSGIEAAAGEAALIEAAERPADWIMSAIVGAAGLAPGFAALKHGTTLALANKESLVTAGPLIMKEARKCGAKILPVDSEHSAVFQALVGEDIATVERVLITASGGAFRDWPLEDLQNATLEQASRHPNWDMGQRITIDSASMFNKSLELIETKEFFGFQSDQIEVLVHPESLVHALVGYHDGAVMAHIGAPDMRHAIGYALNWPKRQKLPVDRLDFTQIGSLNFRAADEARWPALRLAREVMGIGGHAGAAFNAAKERALDAFIAGEIKFTAMAQVVEQVLSRMSADPGLSSAQISLDTVRQMDHLARQYAAEAIRAVNQ